MSESEVKATYREAKILELLNHPGIIHFREIYKNSVGELCIVMNYADGGDLSQLIKSHKEQRKPMTE
jgi:NIMA (never in mitosis gene a)-related kinase